MTVRTRSPSSTASVPTTPSGADSVNFDASASCAPERSFTPVPATGAPSRTIVTADASASVSGGSVSDPTPFASAPNTSVAAPVKTACGTTAERRASTPSAVPSARFTVAARVPSAPMRTRPACTLMVPVRLSKADGARTSAPAPVFVTLPVRVGVPCRRMVAASPSAVAARKVVPEMIGEPMIFVPAASRAPTSRLPIFRLPQTRPPVPRFSVKSLSSLGESVVTRNESALMTPVLPGDDKLLHVARRSIAPTVRTPST